MTSASLDLGDGKNGVVHSVEKSICVEHEVQVHPLGIRPGGNAFGARSDARGNIGAFDTISDDLILTLLAWLDGGDLLRLGQTCRALFAFTCSGELWKALVLQKQRSKSGWHGSWRATWLGRLSCRLPPIDCTLFSDTLYRPFFCSQLDLEPFVSKIPLRNRVSRLTNLSEADFANNWVDRPFILTEPVKEWPAFNTWCQGYLLSKYGAVEFRAEAVDWPLSTYVEYMNHNDDESPLYLFDKDFVRKLDISTEDSTGAYWPPRCFGEDLYGLLGEQRPDSRWLIIGPRNSGSTFHKDPNATSAWNAVIRGSKYWIMFPGSTLPPGVIVSSDQSEVTTPISIAEWLLNFHRDARRMSDCQEGICHEGEVMHVPSGWWHLVVNLTPAIAITQNFVPRAHLRSTLEFLKQKPDQVSGFRSGVVDPYQSFLKALLVEGIEITGSQDKTNGKKRKWKHFVESKIVENITREEVFKFGFEDDIEKESA